jgi:hypothetical protein
MQPCKFKHGVDELFFARVAQNIRHGIYINFYSGATTCTASYQT